MSTHTIILAQGDQKRIPELKIPKQLVRLPACGNVPLLNRTVRQVYHHSPFEPVNTANTIVVVGWPTIADHFEVCPVELKDTRVRPGVCTLDNPGNSSLRGFATYWDLSFGHAWRKREGRAVVLLGDVCYSWMVMHELYDVRRDCVFAVSSDISPSGGELWGIAWNSIAGPDMGAALRHAMMNHPTQTIYQPGQMRLWLWELEKRYALAESVRYVTDSMEGDYTADIDLPKHTTVEFLGALSERAAADDAAWGVTW